MIQHYFCSSSKMMHATQVLSLVSGHCHSDPRREYRPLLRNRCFEAVAKNFLADGFQQLL